MRLVPCSADLSENDRLVMMISSTRNKVQQLPSFEVSVIIPLETYKQKCESQNIQSTSKNILYRGDLPSDVKMKLYDRFHRDERKMNTQTNATPNRSKSVERYDSQAVVNRSQVEHQPYVKSIMELYIDEHQHSISWNPSTFEIMFDGKVVPKTNIVNSLQFLMNPKTIGYDEPPPSTMELKRRLLQIGVPKTWISGDGDIEHQTSQSKDAKEPLTESYATSNTLPTDTPDRGLDVPTESPDYVREQRLLKEGEHISRPRERNVAGRHVPQSVTPSPPIAMRTREKMERINRYLNTTRSPSTRTTMKTMKKNREKNTKLPQTGTGRRNTNNSSLHRWISRYNKVKI